MFLIACSAFTLVYCWPFRGHAALLMPLSSHMGFYARYCQTTMFSSRRSMTTASLSSFLSLSWQNWVFSLLWSNWNFHTSLWLTWTTIAFTCSCSHEAVSSSNAGFTSYSFLCIWLQHSICPTTSTQWRWVTNWEMKLEFTKTLF